MFFLQHSFQMINQSLNTLFIEIAVYLYIKLKRLSMKKFGKKGIVFMPLVITAAMFVVFSDKIKCQPDEAGFWMILALGMSIGLILRYLLKK